MTTADTGGSAGAAPGGTPAPGAGGDTGPWYNGKLDAELIGHLQNRGLADKDPVTVAIEMAKAHRASEKIIGVPADQVLKLPKADDIEGWGKVYERLGRPSTADKYDLNTVKLPNGDALPEAFASFMKQTAFQLNLSQDGATRMVSELLKQETKAGETAIAEKTATLARQKDALAKNWGQHFEANKFVASQAAQRLGLNANEINELQNLIGYDRIMEMFRAVGEQMGEDVFVRGAGNTGGGVMTREQAIAKKADLMADGEWTKRYMNGGAAEKNEMLALNTIIVGGQVAR